MSHDFYIIYMTVVITMGIMLVFMYFPSGSPWPEAPQRGDPDYEMEVEAWVQWVSTFVPPVLDALRGMPLTREVTVDFVQPRSAPWLVDRAYERFIDMRHGRQVDNYFAFIVAVEELLEELGYDH